MQNNSNKTRNLIAICVFLLPSLMNLGYLFVIHNLPVNLFPIYYFKTNGTDITYKYPNIPEQAILNLTIQQVREYTDNKSLTGPVQFSDIDINLIPDDQLINLSTVPYQFVFNIFLNGCHYYSQYPSSELETKLLHNNSKLPDPAVIGFGLNLFQIKLGPSDLEKAEFIKKSCILPQNSKFYIRDTSTNTDKFYE